MSRKWNADTDGKARWFVGTNFDVDTDYEKVLKKNEWLRFVAFGAEVCPETKKDHHQMYFYRKNAIMPSVKVLNAMGKSFGDCHVHVEAMMGRIEDNESYCSKEGRLQKFGKEPKQGTRGDLDECADKIMKGDLTVDEICVENPQFFHQYGRTMDRLEAIALRQRFRTWMTHIIWYWGPSHSGKSRACYQGYDPKTHYVKNLNDEWWDGYTGQEIVIFNEFRGQISFVELLDLADEWPKTVKQRSKEPVPFLAKEIRISCIKEPQEVYVNQHGEPWEQFFMEREHGPRCKTVLLTQRRKRKREDGPLRTEALAAVARGCQNARDAQMEQ